jgi:integrase
LNLTSAPSYYLCMAGHIRTLQRCRKCGKPFPKELLCPTCLTHPTRLFIDIWHRGERLKIYTDPYGFPLDSLARAEQLLATIRHQIGAGKFDPKEYVAKELKSLQFDHYAAVWLTRMQGEAEQRHISRAYLKEIKRYVKSYFIPHFGRLNIRDMRDGQIIDFKRSLPAHLSAKTVANILGVLHRLLAEAKDRGDIAFVPKFPKVAKRSPDTRWLTPAEQEAILAHVREPYRTLFLFCMKQGCRIGEARALRWENLDLKRGAVTIKASMDLGAWKPFTKEGEVRTQPLNSQVKAALLALPRSLAGFVFVNRAGRPLSDTRVRTAWNAAAAKAGIRISAYQGTRHSFATQKLMAGYSERMVMEATGHRTVSAFRRYGKLVTEALREMMEDEPSVATVRIPSVAEPDD